VPAWKKKGDTLLSERAKDLEAKEGHKLIYHPVKKRGGLKNPPRKRDCVGFAPERGCGDLEKDNQKKKKRRGVKRERRGRDR